MNVTLRSSLLIATIFLCFASTANAEFRIDIDKPFSEVAGWKIGFSEGISGCSASATYKDRTTVWMGFAGEKNSSYIAFSNPKWKAIEAEGRYEIQIIKRGRNWEGKFYGFERDNERGIYLTGLKDEFIRELVRSGNLRLLVSPKPEAEGWRRVFDLSFDGSGDAMEEIVNCQKKYIAASSEGESNRKPKQKGESSGTGFFVSSNGHVVTNHHVIDGCTNVTVTAVGSQKVAAQIVTKDKTNDLAILKTSINPTTVPALRTELARVGEPIFVYGFPLSGILSTSGNFTIGAVTAVSGISDDTRAVQISAPVQPGNSGGPLVDKYGNVLGVIVSRISDSYVASKTNTIPQNVNFAIKSSITINFLASHGIAPNIDAKSRERSPEAIADLTKFFTVRVTCF